MTVSEWRSSARNVAGRGITDAVAEARGGVKGDAEALAGGVGAGELGRGPVAIFSDELHVAIAGRRDFLESLFERQIAEDGPEHDGELECLAGGLRLRLLGRAGRRERRRRGRKRREFGEKRDGSSGGSEGSRAMLHAGGQAQQNPVRGRGSGEARNGADAGG